MTVIVWDGYRLAADKRATSNGNRRTITKIRRHGHELLGFSGDLCQALTLQQWYMDGAIPHEFPKQCEEGNQTLVVIGAKREIMCYVACPYPEVYEESYHAWGSGRDYALAAMFLGQNAIEAVRIASHFQVDCGDGYDVLPHGEE